MKKQLQGIALILISIMLILGFDSIGVRYVFDLSIDWATIFMAIGILGFVMTFRKNDETE